MSTSAVEMNRSESSDSLLLQTPVQRPFQIRSETPLSTDSPYYQPPSPTISKTSADDLQEFTFLFRRLTYGEEEAPEPPAQTNAIGESAIPIVDTVQAQSEGSTHEETDWADVNWKKKLGLGSDGGYQRRNDGESSGSSTQTQSRKRKLEWFDVEDDEDVEDFEDPMTSPSFEAFQSKSPEEEQRPE